MGQTCCNYEASVRSSYDESTPAADPVAVTGGSEAEFVADVPLFATLPAEDHQAIVARCERRSFTPGQNVVSQGETGTELFIISDGTSHVIIGGKKVAELSKRDYFGERAMLRGETRAATVQAATNMQCLVISQQLFDALSLRTKVQFKKRGAVQAEHVDVFDQDKPLVKVQKSAASMELIKKAVKESELTSVVDLDEGQLEEIALVAVKENRAAGDEVIRYGDTVAEMFYVLESGTVAISVPTGQDEGGGGEAQAGGGARRSLVLAPQTKVVARKKGPDAFGGLALLYSQPRQATVTCDSACVLWAIGRHAFKQVMIGAAAKELQKFMEFMDKVEVLKSLNKDEKRSVARALQVRPFEKGSNVIKQGDDGKSLFLVFEGELEALKDGKKVMDYKSGSYFGEKALLNNEPRAATVRVKSEAATLLEIDSDTYNTIKKMFASGDKKEEKKVHADYGAIKKNELQHIGYLGAGGFGFVSLEFHKKSNKYYALKGMSKGHLVANNMEASAIAERDLLLMMDSPFIVKLYATYKDKQNLYYLLEACLVGDLYGVCNGHNLYGDEACGAYYSAVVIKAFQHIHEQMVVYRDLKPENLLLKDSGHAQLCDLGIAKKIIGRTYTMCGTPEYMSPEVIQNKGHSFACDWWCLGVFIFELLHSVTPFASNNTFAIYKGINKGIDKITWPKDYPQYKDLIRGLCQKQPTKRLPEAKGIQALLDESFFSKTKWADLSSNSYPVPWAPKKMDPKTCCKGRVSKEDVKSLQVPYKDIGSNWDKEF